ncbi:MAG: hypothetical protein ACW97O_00700 [Candidatus Thorarchaeota archaeon]|jgi:hypothetical protein
MDFRTMKEDRTSDPWRSDEPKSRNLQSINLAPLKGIIESDPVRSKVLRVLIEDGTWVTTADLLRAARQERAIVGAVTIGTILKGMNDLVSSKLILSRTSLSSGIDWAEWRINPDWLRPTRKLLQMLSRPKFEKAIRKTPVEERQSSLDEFDKTSTQK